MPVPRDPWFQFADPGDQVPAVVPGHQSSASTISSINKGLDKSLARFANRHLDDEYPYLILDTRCEKVREDAVIRSQASRARCSSSRTTMAACAKQQHGTFKVPAGNAAKCI